MKKLGRKSFVSEAPTTGGSVISGPGGHVDLPLGQFDRPGPTGKASGKFTYQDFTAPVLPKEMVATQLATERLPVGDDDYVPASSKQLSSAVAELAKMVPDEQIEKFYLRVKELAQDSAEDEEQVPEDVRMSKMENRNIDKRKLLQREMLARAVNKILDEAANLQEALPPPMSRAQWAAAQAAKSKKPRIRGPEQLKFTPADAAAAIGAMSGEKESRKDLQIAKLTGRAGTSGGRQFWLGVFQELVHEVLPVTNQENFDDLKKFAQDEFLKLMQIDRAADGQPRITPEEAKDWESNRDALDAFPAFQYFFNTAFIRYPRAQWKVAKDKSVAINDVFREMALHPRPAHTVWNQIWGQTTKGDNFELIKKKIAMYQPFGPAYGPGVKGKEGQPMPWPEARRSYGLPDDAQPPADEEEAVDLVFSQVQKNWLKMKGIVSDSPVTSDEDLIEKVKTTFAKAGTQTQLGFLRQAIEDARADAEGRTVYPK